MPGGAADNGGMARAATGMAFERVVGRVGDLVVVQLKSGPAVRRRPSYRRSSSPAQKAVAERMRQVSAAWNSMTPEQAGEWHRYARTIELHDRITGNTYSPAGYNAFTGLSTRFLQANPSGEVPLVPPSASFVGDLPAVTVAAEAGQITFTAARANAPGVVTELMLQRLASPRRQPSTRYTSAAFAAYTPEHLTETVTVEPSAYACAVRFVLAATGQAGAVFPLGVVLA